MAGAAALSRREPGLFQVTLPARIAARAQAIQLIVDVCRAHALSLDVEHSVVSAFGEAFNNVCVHSYRGGEGDVAIEVELEPDRLLVRLRDRGVGFDPSAVRAPDLEALPEGGLGIFIMMRAMDDVRWYYEDGENVVALEKRLPRGSS
jgi:serine/threonine-protein kinase RsbW